MTTDKTGLTRRDFVETAAIAAIGASICEAQPSVDPGAIRCVMTVNNLRHEISVDPRATLLDLLREQLHLTGTKKACDHGQCGACTVLVNGERINSCLALAVSLDDSHITTIEGLGTPERLHPMQSAFIEHDGFQCGFCTSGQICSAIAMLDEVRHGWPSAVSNGQTALTENDVRERMAGNICRCGAYPNIVAAILHVAERGGGGV